MTSTLYHTFMIISSVLIVRVFITYDHTYLSYTKESSCGPGNCTFYLHACKAIAYNTHFDLRKRLSTYKSYTSTAVTTQNMLRRFPQLAPLIKKPLSLIFVRHARPLQPQNTACCTYTTYYYAQWKAGYHNYPAIITRRLLASSTSFHLGPVRPFSEEPGSTWQQEMSCPRLSYSCPVRGTVGAYSRQRVYRTTLSLGVLLPFPRACYVALWTPFLASPSFVTPA